MKKLTESQIAYLVDRISVKTSSKKIIEEVKVVYDGLVLTGEDIDDIKLKYGSLIEDRARTTLNDVRGNRLAHSRVRLDIIEQVLDTALADLKPKPIRSVKISEQEYEIVTGIDTSVLSSIAKLLQLAREEEFLNKRLLLELKKLYDTRGIEDDISSSGFLDIQVDTGIKYIDAKTESQ
jgi:hypothetical protein